MQVIVNVQTSDMSIQTETISHGHHEVLSLASNYQLTPATFNKQNIKANSTCKNLISKSRPINIWNLFRPVVERTKHLPFRQVSVMVEKPKEPLNIFASWGRWRQFVVIDIPTAGSFRFKRHGSGVCGPVRRGDAALVFVNTRLRSLTWLSDGQGIVHVGKDAWRGVTTLYTQCKLLHQENILKTKRKLRASKMYYCD